MKKIIISTLSVLFSASIHAQTLDSGLKSYSSTPGISGTLKSIGSDTLNNLMTLWAEGFRKVYPNVQIEIEGKGSSTAPPALVAGTAQFGPMSRLMKGAEIDAFEKKFGYKPTAINVSLDSLAVYVHKDNPIKCLTLQQVDAIFSKNRRGGYVGDITNWSQVEIPNLGPISLYGRNSASGTYGFFKETALFNGDYKDSVKEQPGSSTVVQGVASDKGGIGYSGIGYKTADVRAVPIASKPGSECFEATEENVLSGDYPLARFLVVYVNRNPTQKMDPLRLEFIKFILSKEGQEVNIKDGYYPVTSAIVEDELNKVK
jgi:phosphate transport system substrate-binding protein